MSKIKNEKRVSIITISQLSRFKCIKILFMMIQRQTYQYIFEWIIVEGSKSKEDAKINKENIKNFINEIKHLVNFKIIYIEYTGKKLGDLRNIGNNSCNGDIIVCMDDDDWYPSTRIEEAVEKLLNSYCLISGVSDVYLYDFFLDSLYKFKGFMEWHSTNNCMAYKKSYLLNHKHDPEIEVGEERSFTNEFTTPLVKLDSRKTIIAISHNFNTFNKKELCLGGTLGTLKTLEKINEPITNYIDEDIFLKMRELYVIEEPAKYDIVYMIGGFTNSFDPKSSYLYESERAVVNFCEYWTKHKKKKVAVYGEFDVDKNDIKINGVTYISWKKFPFHHVHEVLILFRTNGFLSTCLYPVRAKKIYWDVYDNFIHNDLLVKFWKLYGNKVNKIFLKSNFHQNEFYKYLELKPSQTIEILPTGLRVSEFSINIDNVSRNPYRFCYTTYYDRGLEFLISGIFSVIKKIEPRAELHIYTGLDMINDEEYKKKMLKLFSEPGVCDHGKQSVDIIAREKYMSSFELYISNIVNEVDCVTIRESIIAGCIPLIANFGVFLERDGFKFDMNHEDSKIMQKNALHILQIIKDQNALNDIRKEFYKNCSTLLSLNQISEIMYNKTNLL